MKKATFLLLMLMVSLFIAHSTFAQEPLITIFSADGYNFKVFMDGKQMNQSFESRVEYMKMDHDWAKVKIVFEDRSLPNVEKTVQGKDADGKISSVTYEVKKTKKGKWKLAISSWKTLEEAKKEMDETENYSDPVQVQSTESNEQPASSTTVVTTETVTTESNSPNTSTMVINAENTSFSMNVDIDDGTENTGVDISIGLPGVSASAASQTQTSQTTITTTTSSGTSTYTETIEDEPEPTPGYHGNSNCSYPMSDDEFGSVKGSISSKDFEDSKLTIAKQVIKSNCLYVSQVKEIMELFDYEDTRLEFAKEAHSSTYDVNNYYQLNDAFEYELTIDELNEFIENQ